jgi:hypothetical protein
MLEFFCCFSITINCVSLLYYNNHDFASPTELSIEQGGASDLDSILIFVNALNIALIAGLFVVTYIELKFKVWSIKKLSKSVTLAVVRVHESVIRNRCALYTALAISHVSDQTDSEEVLLEEFLAATQQCHLGTDAPPSRDAIKVLFFILKLVQGDDNPHALWMSPQMRKDLSSAEKGVTKGLVRICFCRDWLRSLASRAPFRLLAPSVRMRCRFERPSVVGNAMYDHHVKIRRENGPTATLPHYHPCTDSSPPKRRTGCMIMSPRRATGTHP